MVHHVSEEEVSLQGNIAPCKNEDVTCLAYYNKNNNKSNLADYCYCKIFQSNLITPTFQKNMKL